MIKIFGLLLVFVFLSALSSCKGSGSDIDASGKEDISAEKEETGGQLIDTAYMYHNEESVGRAVRDSQVPREEIFVITKLYPSQFADPEAAIARNHKVTSAQVILRWNLQKGVVVIPGSSNPEHIRENLDLFDFQLTDKEMEQINALDRNEKHDWY